MTILNSTEYEDSEMDITLDVYPEHVTIMKTDNENLLFSNIYAELAGKNVINITTKEKFDDFLMEKVKL